MNKHLARLVSLVALLNPGRTPEEIADLSLKHALRAASRGYRKHAGRSREFHLAIQRRRRHSVLAKASRRTAMRKRRGMRVCGMGSKR